MIAALLFAPLIYIPAFINRYSLPKMAYIALLAAGCYWGIKKARKWPYGAIGAIYGLFLIASVKNAINFLEWWLQVSLDISGLIFFYYVVNFVKMAEIPRFFKLFSLVSVLISVTAFFAPWLGVDLELGKGLGGSQGNTSFGAAIQGVGLLASFYLASSSWGGWLLAALPVLAHLVLLKSRATLIGLVLGCICFVTRSSATIRLLTCLVAAFLFFNLASGESWHGRLALWDGALAGWWDFPLFGTGRGNAQFVLPFYVHYSTTQAHFDPQGNLYRPFDKAVHNDFLQLWMEAPGALMAFLILLALILRRLPTDQLTTTLLSMLSVMGAHMMFNFPLELAEQVALIWVLLGLIYVQKRENVEKS